MSHTLHREGTPRDLRDDYIVLMMSAKGINETGAAAKLRRFLRIARRHGAINLGDMKTGSKVSAGAAAVARRVKDHSILQAVFTDVGAVESVLRDVRRARLGLSVTVTGLVAPIQKACRHAKVARHPHTVAHSLGVWGNRRRLPSKELLPLVTMCGHGLVSASLAERAVADVRAGRCSPEKAALTLARPCVCGAFNPHRAARLLKGLR
jgi:hypothetical protein